MTTAANTARSVLSDDRSHAATFSDIKRDVTHLKDDATSFVAASAQTGVETVRKSAESLAEQGKKAAVKGEQVFKTACEYVAERPVISMAFALTIGTIVGRLLSSRSR